jgi:hypothetical protein
MFLNAQGHKGFGGLIADSFELIVVVVDSQFVILQRLAASELFGHDIYKLTYRGFANFKFG